MRTLVSAMCMVSSMAYSGMTEWCGGEIAIIHSDERSLVVEYRPRFFGMETIHAGKTEMKVLDFAGSVPGWSRENAGAPDLRFEALPIGFPAPGGNVVQVIAADYEDITQVTLAPVPIVHFDNEMAERKEYRIDPGSYAASTFVPVQPVELSGPARAQTMWVGSVRVYPVQFNPGTRTLRKYTRLVFEVVFGAHEGVRVHNLDDKLFRGTLLNYDVARDWKSAIPRPQGKVSIAPSALANGDWYRIPIAQEGVYVLTPAFLRSLAINTSTLDPRTIRIFGNGGNELPENIQQPRPVDLIENAIHVEGESDGRLDEGDYVVFYARSVRGWTYDVASHTLSHHIHHYSEENYYWLTFNGGSGKRMQTQASLNDTPLRTPAKFLDGVFAEEENVNIHNSGKDWFGKQYDAGGVHTYPMPLPGLVPDDVVHYTFRLLGLSPDPGASPSFTVKEGTTSLGTFGPLYWNGDVPTPFTINLSGSSNIASNTSSLVFTFQQASLTPKGWDDWVEIKYPRKFDASGNYLRFRSPDDLTGVVQYDLGQFTASPLILDVTHPEEVRRITGAAGSYSFRAMETAGQVSEYCAVASNGFREPGAAARITNQNLRGDTSDVDFIIVTSQEFHPAADRLKQWREQPAHGGLLTRVVEVNQIYNEFSGGVPDVTAIRDYLKHVYDIWLLREHRQEVLFTMFFGQGSYDFKGARGARSSYVPTWQTAESLWDLNAYPSDDFFAAFDGANWQPSIVTGRVNARNPGEGNAFVTKLMRYEEGSVHDSWKMRMVFVGDDEFGENGSFEGTLHSDQAEELATRCTPPEFEKRKIYLAAYPTVQSPQGRRKPGAFQAIIDEINAGALVTNYTGHGNPQVWAHENVFNVQTSIPQLTNRDKLSLFFVATCSFSHFDDPDYETGSEVLVNRADGGAIGVIASSRLAESGANSVLHEGVFRKMLRRDGSGRLLVDRPATALYLFKFTVVNDDNDRKYFFMGDPTMKLLYPPGFVTIDSINHQPIVGASQQLKALARVSVEGTVRDLENVPDTTFRGTARLTVNDVSRHAVIVNFPAGHNWPYLAEGGTIYRGLNSITGGRFSATFVVPKDISYADSAGFGRIVIHSLDASQSFEGAGFRDSVRVGGTENAPPDTSGPEMLLYLNNRSFRAGDIVSENPTLFVDLVDSNGINTSVSGIGHRIEVWVNGSPESKDITEYYSSELDDFQRGTASYPLRDLRQGRNNVRVRAWDTHNNPTLQETFFNVASSDELRISEVFNYPNPFSRGTTFTFRQNLLGPLAVKIKIYTVAGRLIQSLDAASSGESFVRVTWDGRDRDGAVLANGVYLYKIVVTTVDGRLGSESLGKMAVLK